MNIRAFWMLAASLLPIVGWCAPTTLTYQGQLQQAGSEFTGTAGLEFRLFDQETDGAQVGPTVLLNDWPVVDGLFQVELDFGAVYGENPRWLQVTVDGFDLVPRQAVRPAPVALYALSGNDWQLDGSNVYYSGGNVGIGTASPAAKLEVMGNSSISVPLLQLSENEDDYARQNFGNTVNSRFWSIAGLTRGEMPTDDRLNFYHSTSGNLLTLSGSGEGTIGIRNTNPSSSYAVDMDATRDDAGNGAGMRIRANSNIGLPHLFLQESQADFARINFHSLGSPRLWALAGFTDDGADSGADAFNLFNSGSGDLISILGNGRTGIGIQPLSRLTVRSDGQWNPSVGDGRGDFYIGNGAVGFSVGVALGGGGTGVTRLWTSGGVENMFLGSAAHGTSLSVLPGQVGINNTNPGNTLDVDGGVRIRSFSHADSRPRAVRVEANGDLVSAAPSESFLSIHPVAFNPESSGVDFQVNPYLRVNSTTVGTPFSMSLNLEDGTNPSELRIWYEDTDSNRNLRVILCRGGLGTNNCAADAIVTSDTITSGVEELSVPFTGPDIDNSSSSYRLRVYTVDNAGTFTNWSSDLRLWAVRLSYTSP